MKTISVPFKTRAERCEISAGDGLFDDLGRQAQRVLDPATQKIAIISNPKVFGLFGKEVAGALRRSGFMVNEWLMGDGERYKSLGTLANALEFLARFNLGRSDAVLSLGGGVVGDLAGLAAALHLRGVQLAHAPTTFLAQIDASIGGKTAVNTRVGKNIIGAIHQPVAVWIDTATLQTLPRRELTSGWCEAIKQGAAGSGVLFRETYQFLKASQASKPTAVPSLSILLAHCRFKAEIVSRDQREDPNRVDHKSRRILNFGHTTAHALESVTGYRRFRHGEAVGHGMMVAGEISARLGLLPASELELLRSAVRLCGRLPRAAEVDGAKIIDALTHDKKRRHGEPQWVLLERIGRARIVAGREVSRRLLRASLKAGLQALN
ncbi:MAG: 3-dehydroquinate synthase [Blastocatellia bacterium]|jgi:3-dehydroquinate synthase|nr:3-dehydroquinate synthase [Blastocatellia bacterium]